MTKPNRGPFIKDRNGVKWWRYNLRKAGKRYEKWIGAVSEMSRRQAVAEYEKAYAAIVTTGESPVKKHRSKRPATIFKEYREYLERHHPSTYESVKYIAFHWEDFFKPKAQITEQDVIAYQRAKSQEENEKTGKPMSGPSINRHLSYCRAAYNLAKISPNPFDKHVRYKETDRTRYLTSTELKRLLGAVAGSAQTQLKGIVMTAILTGLRKNEILCLHERNIDFGNQLIRIKVKGGDEHTTALPDQLVLLYKRSLKSHKSGYIFENPFTFKKFGDVKRAWRAALKEAKIEDFRFHDLRHTSGTYMLLAGTDVRLVQELLGHSAIRTTQKYTHILNQSKLNASKELASMLTGISDEINED